MTKPRTRYLLSILFAVLAATAPARAYSSRSYASVGNSSAAGVGVFALLARWLHVDLIAAALSGIAVTFGFRLLAIWFDWKTRPVLQPPSIS